MSVITHEFTLQKAGPDVLHVAVKRYVDVSADEIKTRDGVRFSVSNARWLAGALSTCLTTGRSQSLDVAGSDAIEVYMAGPEHMPRFVVSTHRLVGTEHSGGYVLMPEHVATSLVDKLKRFSLA